MHLQGLYLQSLILLLCALYGSIFTIGKFALDYCSPLFLTGSRMILAGLILIGYQFFINRSAIKFKREHFILILIVAITGVYLTNALEFWGLQFIEAGKACFLYSFCPIATAVMSYLWFSEKITLQKWIGLAIGIIGFIPVLAGQSSIEDSTPTFLFLSFAELALLGAAVATSIGWLAMREVIKNRGCSAVTANGVSMLIGGIISLMHSWATETWSPVPVSDFWGFLPWLLCLTVVSNLISYNLHATLLRFFTATYISLVGLTQPLFAALFGWLFLAEILTGYFWWSIIAVSIGLYIYYQQELKMGLAPRYE